MDNTQQVLTWLDRNRPNFTAMADEIWANPELAFKEFKASKLQADYLEEAGFTIRWDIGGLKTGFVAEWGSGSPVIGFAGEYDALPGLSQKVQDSAEPIEAGGNGHGCGHNLLGTGCLAATAAVKHWLQEQGMAGTVRYYGCPAEEGGSGKVYMARDGEFDDLDAAFNFHPGYYNMATKGSTLGVHSMRFRFHGTASHAAASPHLGRSALDAVELMNVGVNYLREHVEDGVRIHYTITNGGTVPNIVPDLAEVYYYVRAHLPHQVEDALSRVRKVARGAAMMTETELEEIDERGLTCLLSNHVLADLQYAAMQAIGPAEFNEQEIAYAETINAANMAGGSEMVARALKLPIGQPVPALIGDYYPSNDAGAIFPASTDVGDMSWKVPVSLLNASCWPTNVAAHSWGVVATGGMSIGHKGMMYAAKVMAGAAIELFLHPEKLQAVRTEFELATTATPYVSPVPTEKIPPQFPHPLR